MSSNGVYPFIDASTGGNIDGMIAGAAQGLQPSNDQTKVVPAMGRLATRQHCSARTTCS